MFPSVAIVANHCVPINCICKTASGVVSSSFARRTQILEEDEYFCDFSVRWLLGDAMVKIKSCDINDENILTDLHLDITTCNTDFL